MSALVDCSIEFLHIPAFTTLYIERLTALRWFGSQMDNGNVSYIHLALMIDCMHEHYHVVSVNCQIRAWFLYILMATFKVLIILKLIYYSCIDSVDNFSTTSSPMKIVKKRNAPLTKYTLVSKQYHTILS